MTVTNKIHPPWSDEKRKFHPDKTSPENLMVRPWVISVVDLPKVYIYKFVALVKPKINVECMENSRMI